MALGSLGAAHVTAAIVALALGLVVLLGAKGNTTHRLFGLGYVGAMVLVNATALGLYRLDGQFGPFHALALLSLAIVVLGTFAVLRRRQNWLGRHYRCMAYSYLGLWAAAVAEAATRLKLFGPLGTRGIFALGVAIALLFTAFGYLVLARLPKVALRVSDRREPALRPRGRRQAVRQHSGGEQRST